MSPWRCLLPCLPAFLQDVLSDLPAEMEFLIFVAAYKNSQKPGFVPPIVNNREIDLYTVREGGCGYQQAVRR